MSESGKLGIYISNNTIEFIHMDEFNQVKTLIVEANLNPSQVEQPTVESLSKGTIEISGQIINALNNAEITATNGCLALPAKDIIFRSFSLPWMQPNEINNAVQFEANKYVPFNLDDLYYSVHPITVTEGGSRQLRIIFVAIKKTVLQYYKEILSNANLTIELSEPSSQSLIRALTAIGQVSDTGTIAIIDHNQTEGNITILEDGVAQFVRSFQLTATGAQDISPKSLLNKLVNESTISLEYYSRQHANHEVEKIIYLGGEQNPNAIKTLNESLGVDIEQVGLDKIIPNTPGLTTSMIAAQGCTLFQTVQSKALFSLIDPDEDLAVAVPSFTEREPIKPKAIVVLAIICASIISIAYLATSGNSQRLKEEISRVEATLVEVANKDAVAINKENGQLIRKLKSYKALQLDGKSSFFLKSVPKALPKGVWLEEITLEYPEITETAKKKKSKKKTKKNAGEDKPKITLSIAGYAYLPKIKDQFNLVNKYLRELKRDGTFTSHFDAVDLKTVQARTVNTFKTTFFEIMCD